MNIVYAWFILLCEVASKNGDRLEHAAGRIRRRWPKPSSVRLMQFLMLKRISDSWQQWSEKSTWEVLSSSLKDRPSPVFPLFVGHIIAWSSSPCHGDRGSSTKSCKHTTNGKPLTTGERGCTVTPENQLHYDVCRRCVYIYDIYMGQYSRVISHGTAPSKGYSLYTFWWTNVLLRPHMKCHIEVLEGLSSTSRWRFPTPFALSVPTTRASLPPASTRIEMGSTSLLWSLPNVFNAWPKKTTCHLTKHLQ